MKKGKYLFYFKFKKNYISGLLHSRGAQVRILYCFFMNFLFKSNRNFPFCSPVPFPVMWILSLSVNISETTKPFVFIHTEKLRGFTGEKVHIGTLLFFHQDY